jgi:leucine dehydrogenase
VGRSVQGGVGGDPSPATARTVLGAIQAALDVLDGDDALAGRTVGVIGLGQVGGRLAAWLAEAGAHVVAYEPVATVAGTLEGHAGIEFVATVEDLLAREFDVLAPCAIGGMVDEQVAASLRARVVCGAANNVLSGEEAAAVLARREILHVPDFLANCGGLIHVDAERRGETDPDGVERALAEAQARTRAVLVEARAEARPPSAVAEEHAWARIALARTGAVAATA